MRTGENQNQTLFVVSLSSNMGSAKLIGSTYLGPVGYYLVILFRVASRLGLELVVITTD